MFENSTALSPELASVVDVSAADLQKAGFAQDEMVLAVRDGDDIVSFLGNSGGKQKPIVTGNKNDTHIDILWSDPHVDVLMFGPNFYRDPAGVGVGHVFGPIQINKFVKRNNLSLIVRAHQPPITGYERIGKHLLTIFSTAGYRVEKGVGNMGASLVIDENGGMTVVRFQVGEQLKMKCQRYKMDKADRYRDCGKPKLKKNVDVDDRYD
ncbi:unnamed protein product [Cylicocyclus nassatus]|uniref:Calcineurin-like phosphoesterase domain-containing protein n=1 Tax=Cylicocyclus nassatus TaxID=53992 RepID=A0AA36DQA3_CYLNA|nr:unnamed protein product [Cylicocyclus nassatus]